MLTGVTLPTGRCKRAAKIAAISVKGRKCHPSGGLANSRVRAGGSGSGSGGGYPQVGDPTVRDGLGCSRVGRQWATKGGTVAERRGKTVVARADRRVGHRVGLVVASLVLGVLAACNPPVEDPSATSTSTPTATPTPTATAAPTSEAPTTEAPTPEVELTYEEERTAAAKQFVLDSYAASAEVANASYVGWEEMLTLYYLGAPDLYDSLRAFYEQSQAEGDYTVGAAVVTSMEITSWTDDSSEGDFDVVEMRICVDPASLRSFSADGAEHPEEILDHPYPSSLKVMGQSRSPLGWSFLSETPFGDETC